MDLTEGQSGEDVTLVEDSDPESDANTAADVHGPGDYSDTNAIESEHPDSDSQGNEKEDESVSGRSLQSLEH